VVVASLKIYGELYFSRYEVISGEARADVVNSFLAGCVRSQRNMAANAGRPKRKSLVIAIVSRPLSALSPTGRSE
jgi:hypothetical protein